MDDTLKREIAKYLFPYIGNGCYRNEYYYDALVKKYSKKIIYDALQEESKYGTISDAFTY